MVHLIFNILVQPFILASKFTSFYHISVFLSKMPFVTGDILRYYFYKKMLKSVGENVVFSYGVIFTHQNIVIGNNVRFGPYNTIGLVDFGDDILIGQYVHFLSGKNQHNYDRKDIPICKQGGSVNKIIINNDNWVGSGSIIMASVSKGNVIAAGSIVVKTLGEYSVIAGNPAKIIKKR